MRAWYGLPQNGRNKFLVGDGGVVAFEMQTFAKIARRNITYIYAINLYWKKKYRALGAKR